MLCLNLIWAMFLCILDLTLTSGALFSNSMVINGLKYTFIYDDTVKSIHITEAIVSLANIVVGGKACSEDDAVCRSSLQDLSDQFHSNQELLDPDIQLAPLTPSSDFLGDIDVVLLNLGSNIDPVIPELFVPLDRSNHNNDNNDNDNANRDINPLELVWRGDAIRTIAFEPVPGVLRRIDAKPWLHLVAAAVASYSGVKPMFVYNIDAVSSSLHESNNEFVTDDTSDGQLVLAPVVSLQSVMDMIPVSTDIAFLKSDIQGDDFEAIQSIGSDLLRIKWLSTEVWHHNIQSYKGVRNDFCRDWLPYMTTKGFSVRAIGVVDAMHYEYCLDILEHGDNLYAHCEDNKRRKPTSQPGLAECDVLWARGDVVWEDYSQLPPVSGMELINYRWVARGHPLYNVSINRF